MKRRNFGGIFFALALVLLGIVLLGFAVLGWHWVAGWWALLIGVLALVSIFSHGPRFFNLLLLLGSLVTFARWQDFLIHNWREYYGSLIAVAVISLGLALIAGYFRPQKPWTPIAAEHTESEPYCPPPPRDYDTPPQGKRNVPPTGEEFPTRFALFSSENLRSDCKHLRGARLSAIFGGVMADFRQADFTQPVAVEANCLFGGIDIYTPQGVRVECVGTSIFGGHDARAIAGRPYDPTHPILTIRYLNLFGGTNIK